MWVGGWFELVGDRFSAQQILQSPPKFSQEQMCWVFINVVSNVGSWILDRMSVSGREGAWRATAAPMSRRRRRSGGCRWLWNIYSVLRTPYPVPRTVTVTPRLFHALFFLQIHRHSKTARQHFLGCTTHFDLKSATSPSWKLNTFGTLLYSSRLGPIRR